MISGNFSFNVSIISAVSSTDNVVCVIYATGFENSLLFNAAASLTVSISFIEPFGNWPIVPITSGWLLWPISIMS